MVTSRRPSRELMVGSHCSQNPGVYVALALLLVEMLLVVGIIACVPYTKIDWDAYIEQVDGFLKGERNYWNLKGDTGPLVYPAGFLYIYSIVKTVTGGDVHAAQIIFAILYLINLGIVLLIYVKTDALPLWALFLLCASKRIHSIFVLRLFNDCFVTTILHASLLLLICHWWKLGFILFSFALSVKMNVLLYAPSLLVLLFNALGGRELVYAITGGVFVQILLGLPFLVSHPVAYISRAFDLGRVFIHFWSVNFKFVPEPIFLSKQFALFLLLIHLCLLVVFAHVRWCKDDGGLFTFLQDRLCNFITDFRSSSIVTPPKNLNADYIGTTMFTGNFIGIICARSLHYQFYSWYFFSLPYLLWKTPYPVILRLMLFFGVELCWNIYPSSYWSSSLLLFLHLIILFGLWFLPPEKSCTVTEDDSIVLEEKIK